VPHGLSQPLRPPVILATRFRMLSLRGTITHALTDALKRNAPLKQPAVIRPWLQSFTATWIRGYIPYGAYEVRQQIDAALALGIEEYMIWDPSNVYPPGAFLTEEEAGRRAKEISENREAQGRDHLNRTAEQAVNCYLQAVKQKDWRGGLLITGFQQAVKRGSVPGMVNRFYRESKPLAD